MVIIGFAVAWWGYLEIVYGFSLLKGWDITWTSLANPLHPYQWPPKGQDPPLIPPTQILPTSKSKAATAAAGGLPPPATTPTLEQ